MPLESTIICMDNSEWMRNGDFSPSRFMAQYDAVDMLASRKTNENPENTVGLVASVEGSPRLVCSLTTEAGNILSKLHRMEISGENKTEMSMRVAKLALKHRPNPNGGQRIVVFVGSPIVAKKWERLATDLKKSNIAVDFICMGEENENSELLEKFFAKVNKEDNSHVLHVPIGHDVANFALTSPSLGGSGNTGGDAAGGAPQDFSEFGGIDPSMDPELAMVLRQSMEEAQSAGIIPATQSEQPTTSAAPQTATTAPVSEVPMEEEDPELAAALAMSLELMNEDSETPMDESAAPAIEIVNTPVEGDMEVDAVEDEKETEEEIEERRRQNEEFNDPDFVASLLQSIPGVDMNDPEILGALASLGGETKTEEEKKEEEQKESEKDK
eukprot:TRINITY_DN31368_c0_g1_i1.p1 TRINITY_DN31368_c0_g1~~TRINITY_DN31368_c0_g1_i1.p1  ORF type:complete len:385 (-),score=161.20 TRINITY_DN31368_c0_g1_i1:166-1320(-)